MREYIRHPSDIPIQYHLQGQESRNEDQMKNISTGGLSFHSSKPIQGNSKILINIPIIKAGYKLNGLVVWCQQNDSGYDIGVKFLDKETEFRLRMIEQICYIEHYRREMFMNEGRKLTSEEAALEWIEKFAPDFPSD